MDVEEANKFINALVKNLQVLCHGHVNFNSSIQVIGHLYLNVDSDTNIDYIVNEKVCKSDSSSTVFVSKSYHSEPKSPVKPPQSNNRSDSTDIRQNILPVSIPSLSQPISKRRPVPKRISSKNIHPAYRDNISSFESPVKIPRLSLGDFKASTPIDAKQQAGAEIDLCIVKQEPGVEREKEELQSSDHSNVPGPSFDRSSDESNQNEQTYSNQFNKSSIPVPVELHDNNSNMDMKLDTVFSQSLDTSSSMASPQFGPFDGSSIDNNLKIQFSKEHSEMLCKRPKTLNRETYDTISDLVLGRFNIPKKDRSLIQKAAIVRYYRTGKEKWMVKQDGCRSKLFLCGEEIGIEMDMQWAPSYLNQY